MGLAVTAGPSLSVQRGCRVSCFSLYREARSEAQACVLCALELRLGYRKPSADLRCDYGREGACRVTCGLTRGGAEVSESHGAVNS